MGTSNVLYRGVRLDIKATGKSIDVAVKDQPTDPIVLQLAGQWKREETGEMGTDFSIAAPGVYRFRI
jgi:hypothetical protein